MARAKRNTPTKKAKTKKKKKKEKEKKNKNKFQDQLKKKPKKTHNPGTESGERGDSENPNDRPDHINELKVNK